jgi:hypothetical protein
VIADHLDDARAELRVTTKAQIDTTAADTWGARAVIAWEFYSSTGDIRWRDVAVEYAHEAIEHAASGVPGTLERVRGELRSCTGGAL